MGRPPGSKNKKTKSEPAAQQQSASPKTAAIGDNSGTTSVLSPQEQRDYAIMKKPQYKAALAAKKKAAKDFLDFCKKTTAVGGDHIIRNIEDLVEMETPEGEKKFKEESARRREVARWANLPEGTQGDLLEDAPDRRPLRDKALQEGREAALEDKLCDPPYTAHEAREAWIEGWHDGTAQRIRLGIKPTEGTPVQPAAPGADTFDNDILNEGAGEEPPKQGAAAFRENVAAGDQHIKDTAAAMAAEKAPAPDDGGIPEEFRRTAETTH